MPRLLAPLTHLLAPHSSLNLRASLRSFVCSLTYSGAKWEEVFYFLSVKCMSRLHRVSIRDMEAESEAVCGVSRFHIRGQKRHQNPPLSHPWFQPTVRLCGFAMFCWVECPWKLTKSIFAPENRMFSALHLPRSTLPLYTSLTLHLPCLTFPCREKGNLGRKRSFSLSGQC